MNAVRIFTFGLLFLTVHLHGQENLVPNPSFEDLDNCIDDRYQINRAAYWFPPRPLPGAFSSVDLFHECATAPDLSPPTAGGDGPHSDQPPRTGAGHISVLTYTSGSAADTRRSAETKLKRGLKRHTDYYVVFYAIPERSSRPGARQAFSDGLGIKFIEETFTSLEFGGGAYRPPGDVIADEIIDDLQNWTRIHGAYSADGDETHLLIRSLKEQSDVALAPAGSENVPDLDVYYFVDDVGVYEFDPLPTDTVLCPGTPLMFDATFFDATYRWSDGTRTATKTITESGFYYVEATIDGVTLRDSMEVYDGEVGDFRLDTVLCEGGALTLTPDHYGDYYWDTGDTTAFLTTVESGTYRADILNECGTSTYEANVRIDDCICAVFVPNAFSPNDDGNNDAFEPQLACSGDYTGTLEIYDRFGGRQYQQDFTTGDRVQWRAARNFGIGVYVYRLVVRSGGRVRRYTGSVTLLR